MGTGSCTFRESCSSKPSAYNPAAAELSRFVLSSDHLSDGERVLERSHSNSQSSGRWAVKNSGSGTPGPGLFDIRWPEDRHGDNGLSLCGFLVVHLGGNLLLYAGEEKFNAYAHALHSQGALLKIAEIGLFTLFAGHLGLAISTGAMNKAARQQTYAVKESKQGIFALPAGGPLPGWV